VLATHYDSKKLADKDNTHPEQPVPGANDSASGVAILIELARILADSGTIPNIGIDFVFFDGEEGEEIQGSDYSGWQPLGSTYFADNLKSLYPLEKPISALVLDMVCDKDLKIYKEKSSSRFASQQMNQFWSIAAKIDPDIFQNSIRSEIRDDHTPLNEAGIPGFLLIDLEYPPYHTTEDTPDKCSAENLEIVGNAVLQYLLSIK
jgi:Zn-dependent M28 family amino/carboxypeptidase